MKFQGCTSLLSLGIAASLLAQVAHANKSDVGHPEATAIKGLDRDTAMLRMTLALLPSTARSGERIPVRANAPVEKEGLSLRISTALTTNTAEASNRKPGRDQVELCAPAAGAQLEKCHKGAYRDVSVEELTLRDEELRDVEMRSRSKARNRNSEIDQTGPRSPAAEALLEKYYKGAYRDVGLEGLTLLDAEPQNAELRFIVANSLAWTGYSGDALLQYESLAGTDYHDRALLGLGNVNRWNGRPDRAAAAYREILRNDSGNENAQEGMRLASRELRPRTGARLGRAGNSNDAFRTWGTLSHHWRNGTGAKIYELTAGRAEESRDALRVVQRDLTFHHENLDSHLAQVEVSAQEAPSTKLFGAIVLKAIETPVQIHLGRVNWGKLAFDPAALRDGLTANWLGAKASLRQGVGEFRLAYNAYRVSDDNLIQDANIHFTPSLQPFGTSSARVFIGIEARKARFNNPRYWSPEDGHYNGLVGISGDWTKLQWQTYGSIQYGVPLTGESGRSWSTGVGTKRWLGENWAASADLWAIHTPRDGGYRSYSGSLRIERLW